MPTTRPRFQVTETDAVARALDDAAKRWPDEAGSRAKLLLRLLAEGHRAVLSEQQQSAAAHRNAITRTSGACTGLYGEDYLGELRKDWPA